VIARTQPSMTPAVQGVHRYAQHPCEFGDGDEPFLLIVIHAGAPVIGGQTCVSLSSPTSDVDWDQNGCRCTQGHVYDGGHGAAKRPSAWGLPILPNSGGGHPLSHDRVGDPIERHRAEVGKDCFCIVVSSRAQVVVRRSNRVGLERRLIVAVVHSRVWSK
jgi:hypothetical protein